MTRFTSRRGRPKSDRPRTDMGTPELILKRALDETAEAIDLCLQRRIITRDQHWCGLHLRWLYTIRYGAPGISAIDLTRIDGMEMIEDSLEWRSAREKEFSDAAQRLKSKRCYQPVMQLCVFNERPNFLRRDVTASAFDNTQRSDQIEHDISRLHDGLDLLVDYWHAPVT